MIRVVFANHRDHANRSLMLGTSPKRSMTTVFDLADQRIADAGEGAGRGQRYSPRLAHCSARRLALLRLAGDQVAVVTARARQRDEFVTALTRPSRHNDRHTGSRLDAVFRAHSIPPDDRYQYECDHDIALAFGRSNVAANLWPQPNVEVASEDGLEIEMQHLVCRGQLALPQAQREIEDDWSMAYDRYVLHALPPSPPPGGRQDLRGRLGSALWRLSRSWQREID